MIFLLHVKYWRFHCQLKTTTVSAKLNWGRTHQFAQHTHRQSDSQTRYSICRSQLKVRFYAVHAIRPKTFMKRRSQGIPHTDAFWNLRRKGLLALWSFARLTFSYQINNFLPIRGNQCSVLRQINKTVFTKEVMRSVIWDWVDIIGNVQGMSRNTKSIWKCMYV